MGKKFPAPISRDAARVLEVAIAVRELPVNLRMKTRKGRPHPCRASGRQPYRGWFLVRGCDPRNRPQRALRTRRSSLRPEPPRYYGAPRLSPRPMRSHQSSHVACENRFVIAYSEDDLSNLLVRLHVSIRLDDCVEGKGLGDFRFEFSGVDPFVDVALGSRESLRIGHDGLRHPVATDSQRLLESWYERKWRLSHRQPAIFDDHRPESGRLRELAEQRTSDRIE